MYTRGNIIYYILITTFVVFFILELNSGTKLSNSGIWINTFFEFIVIISATIGFSFEKKRVITSIFIFLFIVLSFVTFNMNNINNYDDFYFFLIFKSIFYLFIFTLPFDSSISERRFIKLYYVILFIFAFKYVISVFFFGVKRPWVYTENNFELMLLLFLFSYVLYYRIDVKLISTAVLIFAIILSGSRSAQSCLLFILFMSYQDRTLKETFLKYFLLIISTFLVLYAFIERLGSADLSSIDRILFFKVFLLEIRDFSFLEILFGRPNITPLSTSSCDILAYYSGYNQICFSSVLHSYIFRVIIDHGIIGFILILIIYFKHLSYLGADRRFAITVIGIAILNGLSVSSFNNVYFIISMIMLKLVLRKGSD